MFRAFLTWLLSPRQRKLDIRPEVTAAAIAPLERMQENLDRILEMPGLNRVKRTRTIPAAFFKNMKAALEAYDQFLEVVVEQAPLQIQCHSGCSHCCCDAPTGVRASELLLIYYRYRRFPDFLDLHNRACSLSDMLMADLKRVAPRKITLQSDSRAYQLGQLRYRRRKEHCVLLDTDGCCRIYDVRPIVCRMHYSLDSPELCWADHSKAKKARSINIAPPAPITERLDAIDEALGLQLTRVLLVGLTELGKKVFEGKSLRARGTRVGRSNRKKKRKK